MRAVLTIFSLLYVSNLFAQSKEIQREIKYSAEAGTIISTNGETPFWLSANQYGIVPNQSPIFTLRGSVSSNYKKAITKEDKYKLSKFDWGYGLNIVGNVGKENQVLIPEVYIKAKFGAFEIYAGRRKEIVGLVDSTLSSGSYIWSGNALPMPKIQILTPNFVPLGFTNGFLSFKGNYAHGWFENNRTDVKNFYLHQKSLYFRLGKPDWKFHFYGGFNHQVQWGGELLYPDPNNISAFNGKVGSSFNDYINIVTGRSLSAQGDTATKVGINDAGNRSGNHLGTIDFGFDAQYANIGILVYRQSIYDTGTLYYLSNITDGLQGVSITNKKLQNGGFKINKFTFEYLNTYGQGGETDYSNTNARLRGLVNYFNNAVYRDGWIYESRILGSPFMTTFSGSPTQWPNIFRVGYNRLEAFFLGLNLNVNKNILLESKFSYAQYYGLGGVNSLKKTSGQYSSVINIKIPVNFLNNGLLVCSIAYDKGIIIKDNAGIYIGIQKKW